MALPRLDNAAARRVFLDRHALGETPAGSGKGDDLLRLIERLGFVQVDSVRTVERAHDMILFARRPSYRPKALKHLLERDRALFEHWTHDAAVIPMAFWPHWRLRFVRDRARLRERWEKWHGPGFDERFGHVLQEVRERGAVSTNEMTGGESRGSTGWWDWHPSKTALEYHWRSGDLSIARRDAFRKVYDLSERVIPEPIRNHPHVPDETADWLNHGALDRLGFATHGEIAAFWDILRPEEVRMWCARQREAGALEEVEIEGADGTSRRCFAKPGLLASALDAPPPPSRLRVLSPFDPALRDRKRAERLFGFRYRIEIFTPAAQRQYGYYVFPLLEGDRLVGRIDMAADRATDCLRVTALWPERGTRWGKARQTRLESELERMARFTGLQAVDYAPGWLRDPQ